MGIPYEKNRVTVEHIPGYGQFGKRKPVIRETYLTRVELNRELITEKNSWTEQQNLTPIETLLKAYQETKVQLLNNKAAIVEEIKKLNKFVDWRDNGTRDDEGNLVSDEDYIVVFGKDPRPTGIKEHQDNIDNLKADITYNLEVAERYIDAMKKLSKKNPDSTLSPQEISKMEKFISRQKYWLEAETTNLPE